MASSALTACLQAHRSMLAVFQGHEYKTSGGVDNRVRKTGRSHVAAW